MSQPWQQFNYRSVDYRRASQSAGLISNEENRMQSRNVMRAGRLATYAHARRPLDPSITRSASLPEATYSSDYVFGN